MRDRVAADRIIFAVVVFLVIIVSVLIKMNGEVNELSPNKSLVVVAWKMVKVKVLIMIGRKE
jgi:hypothetical protein